MTTTNKNTQINNLPVHGIEFKFFYVSEVAAMLRVGTPIIYKLINEGQLEAVKIGRSWKITETAIISYINSLGT